MKYKTGPGNRPTKIQFSFVNMLSQIENTPNGYIVGVYISDLGGGAHWFRLRNFGEHQGDAIEFRDYDIPKFTDAEIRLFARTFKIDRKYSRIGYKHYVIQR